MAVGWRRANLFKCWVGVCSFVIVFTKAGCVHLYWFATTHQGFAGIAGFLLPFGILTDMAAVYDQLGLHIVQEASSGAIALGLLSASCAFNFARSRFMHLVFLVFFLLLALLHWIDCCRGFHRRSTF